MTAALDPVTLERLLRVGFLGRLERQLAMGLIEGAYLSVYPARARTLSADEEVQAGIAVYGLQRIYISAPDGRQLTIRYVFTGELLGALRIPMVHVSIATQALEEAAVLHLVPEQVQRLMSRDPELGLAIADEYAIRLGYAYRTLTVRAFATVRERVAHDLALRAEALGSADGTPVIRVTEQQLADAVGSVRGVVAGAIRDLCGREILARSRGAIRVLAPHRLLIEAGPRSA
jgi:CRP/FNR family cyclic AMP-dependent transcriptional regulator